MIKILFLLLLAVGSLLGDGIKWQKEYNTAIKVAKQQDKPLLFIISNHNCRYCLELESTTLKNPKVIQKVNSEFVALILYVDQDPVFPRDLYVGGTPATWFIEGNGEPMFQPLMGAIGKDDFLRALELVKQESKKGKK